MCRFLLQLSLGAANGGMAVLNIVETNPFRHLNHLSLKFVPASDTYLKKYLAECLIAFKVCVMEYMCMGSMCCDVGVEICIMENVRT